MRYFKQQGCEEPSHQTFLEIGELDVLRCVDVRPDSKAFPIVSSNVELVFPEDLVDWDSLLSEPDNPYPIERISPQEFEAIWALNLRRNDARWGEIKSKYPIGTSIKGGITLYTEPGVLLELEPYTYCLIGTEECTDGIKDYPPFPINKTVRGRVVEYDETNQWLLLDDLTFDPELYPISPSPQFVEWQD